MADTSGVGNSRRMSSSAELSSPPSKSPESPVAGDSIVVFTGRSQAPTPSTSTTSQPAVKPESTAKPKRVRKPKIAADGTEITPKPRKSRAKKKEPDQPAPSTTTTASTTAPLIPTTKTTAVSQSPAQTSLKAPRQSKINELMSPVANNTATQQVVKSEGNPKIDRIGTTLEAIQNSTSQISEQPLQGVAAPQHQLQQQTSISTSIPQPQPPLYRPQAVSNPISFSSGQNYDPIRSSTITAPRPIPTSNPSTPVQSSAVRPAIRASTSPSIASLINPPTVSIGSPISRPSSSLSPTKPSSIQSDQPEAMGVRTATPLATPVVKAPTPPIAQIDAMEIDSKPADTSRKTSLSNGSAASPAPAKPKEKPAVVTPKLPPLPGQGYGSTKESATKAIIVHVPLNGERHKYINFQRLAVEKYGFNAVYPKLALQKEHLARVAANAAALERKPGAITSNDEMSIDGSDNEGEMSSSSKRKATGEIEEPTKKKRLTYEDMYDRDDPFVDDSEMAWEESAAAVQDGFFVYSGALVQPGSDAKVEKPEGAAPKKKSRPTNRTASKTATSKTTKPDEKDKDKKEEEKKDAKPTTTSATATATKDTAEPKKAKPPAAPRKRPTKAEADARRAERERIAKEKAAAAAGNTATTSATTTSTTSTNTPTLVSNTTNTPTAQTSTAAAASTPVQLQA